MSNSKLNYRCAVAAGAIVAVLATIGETHGQPQTQSYDARVEAEGALPQQATANSTAQETAPLTPPATPPEQPAGQTGDMSRQAAHEGAQPSNDQPRTDSRDLVLPPPITPIRDEFAEGRTTDRAQLGVYLVSTSGAGVRVASVTSGTAAAAADVRPGDVILAINGENVAAPADAIERIRRMAPGQSVDLQIWRSGQEFTATAMLQPTRVATIENVFYESSPDEYVTEVRGRRYYYYPRRTYSYYSPGVYGYDYYARPFAPNVYYYRYPYSYEYYGTPRYGYYSSPWGAGVQIGPFGFRWR
jgi:membrane-associated protease RseP (regulator of RpoE activity)